MRQKRMHFSSQAKPVLSFGVPRSGGWLTTYQVNRNPNHKMIRYLRVFCTDPMMFFGISMIRCKFIQQHVLIDVRNVEKDSNQTSSLIFTSHGLILHLSLRVHVWRIIPCLLEFPIHVWLVIEPRPNVATPYPAAACKIRHRICASHRFNAQRRSLPSYWLPQCPFWLYYFCVQLLPLVRSAGAGVITETLPLIWTLLWVSQNSYCYALSLDLVALLV